MEDNDNSVLTSLQLIPLWHPVCGLGVQTAMAREENVKMEREENVNGQNRKRYIVHCSI